MLKALAIAILTSIASFFWVLLPIMSSIFPDCSPGQLDGQCGLGTALAHLFSYIGAATVFVFTSVVSFLYFREK